MVPFRSANGQHAPSSHVKPAKLRHRKVGEFREVPLPDVAELMGHTSIEETYRTYRHLMRGSITKAARILDAGPWEAA